MLSPQAGRLFVWLSFWLYEISQKKTEPHFWNSVNRSDFLGKIWSGRWDSNPRPQPWQGCALPLSYARIGWAPFTDDHLGWQEGK